jgi:ubiquitin-protein ligase
MLQSGRPLIDLGIKNGDTIALKSNSTIPKTDGQMVNPLVQPADNPGQVTVNLNVLDVNRVDKVTLDTSQTIGEILTQVISDYNLLTFNPKLKQTYTYKLGSKALGRYLNHGETLDGADVPSGDTLTIYREEVAGATNSLDARSARLQREYTELMSLSKRGARKGGLINIVPLNYKEGCPVEEYIITFKCRGIIGIKHNNEPIYGEFHQVKLTLGAEFPVSEPYLRWLTPIWHPNIEHLEPHHVCTNNIESWWPGRALTDLILTLGEMVQYKQYHAAWIPPFPLDRDAAKWVEEYAQPNGLVNPGKPVDKRHLLPPRGVRSKSKKPARRKIIFKNPTPSPEVIKHANDSSLQSADSSRVIRFGARSKKQ